MTIFQDMLNHKVFNAVKFISTYLKTLWFILTRPKTSITNVLLRNNTLLLLSPGTFLISNIMVVYSIDYLFGYELPHFPFNFNMFQNSFGSFTFLIIRYILGIVIFAIILWTFIIRVKLDAFISRVLTIFCYTSAIYVPFVIVKGFCGHYFGGNLINAFARLFFNTELDGDLNNNKILFYLSITILLTIFYLWLWLVYYGLSQYNLCSVLRLRVAFISTVFIFFIIQFTSMYILSYAINNQTLNGLEIIVEDRIEHELSKKPPNYLMASILSETISENILMPKYAQYAFKLKKIVYSAANPTFANNATVIRNAISTIEAKNYIETEKILTANIKRISTLYNLSEEITQIAKLRSSPDFVDLVGQDVQIIFVPVDELKPFSPDAIRVKGNRYVCRVPVLFAPSLISVFP